MQNIKKSVSLISLILLSATLLLSLFFRNLSEYFFDLMIVLVLVWTAQKKVPWSFRNLIYDAGFNLVLWMFWGWLTLTLVINPPPDGTFLQTVLQFVWIPALFVFARLLSIFNLKASWFQAAALVLCLCMFGLIAYYIKFPESGETWGFPNRLRGTFTNTNFLAHSYFLIFIFVWSLFVSFLGVKDKFSSVALGFASIAILITLFFTFNRSILLSLILMTALPVFFLRRKAALYSAVVFLLIFSFLYLSNIAGIKGRLENSFHPEKTYDAIRITLWKTNLRIFLENPIAGIGYLNNTKEIDTYFHKYNVSEHALPTHSHNEIISFLAGTGLVGALLYLSLFTLFFSLGLKTLPFVYDKPIHRGLLLGALTIQPAFIVAGFADNNFEIHEARSWLIISWAVLIWLASEHQVTFAIRFLKKTGS